mgnify:FL=1
MSYSKQISDLRANNWRHLTNLQAQSSALGRIESAQHTDQAKLWGLLGEKGTKAVKALHSQRMEHRIAQAHSDFMMHKLDQYLESDDAEVTSKALKAGEKLHETIDNNLIPADIPYHLKV